MAEVHKGQATNKGRTWTQSDEARARNKGRVSNFKGKTLSVESRLKISQNRKGKAIGEANGVWQGGRSKGYKTGYYSIEYNQWRKKVFERDNYSCQECGATGCYLTAHHIKSFAHYPALRFELSNGQTLCEPCHEKTDNYKGRANRLKINF